MLNFFSNLYSKIAQRPSSKPNSPKGQTMTKPISAERLVWINERRKVVEECIRIAKNEMQALQSGGAMRDDMYAALREFNAERTALLIEAKVLMEIFEVSA